MRTELRLTLLGTPQVWQDGKVVQGFRTVKTQALFYYLAVTRRAHTRGALATLLWGDMPERNALVSLSKSLSNLRDLFPDHLEINRHFVAFNSHAPYWLDVAVFEAGFGDSPRAPQPPAHFPPHRFFYNEASIDHLQRIADLYRGDFLAGFVVNNAPDFDAWQSTEGQRLRELAIQGLDRLTNRYAALGNWAEAIACCRKVLTLEAWREETHRQLMRLLVANGERTAALFQYELCLRALEDELAVEPEAETEQLHDQIVAGTFGMGEASRHWQAQAPPNEQGSVQRTFAHSPPPRLSSLIGREQELAALRQLAHSPVHRLVTLLGPGGVGKTTLALACAELLRADFRDGVRYVSFAGVDSQSASDTRAMAEAKLSAIFIDALGIVSRNASPPETAIANFLYSKHLLLVLDNFDPFVSVAPLLARLLANAPAVHCLVTARQALRPTEGVSEIVFPVAYLPTPAVDEPLSSTNVVADLMRFAAIALFVQNAQRLQSDFRLTNENARPIAQICRSVGGLPLGIELAATWLNTLTPEEIAEELARGLDLLDAPPLRLGENENARQPTGIRTVFERSWQLLSPQERRCAAQFSVFQGGASREAALWVTAATLPQLSALVSKSMVRRTMTSQNGSSQAGGRYEMHPLLRHYCAEKLMAEDDASTTRSRHSTYYLMLVQEREKAIKRRDAKQRIQEMRLELDNIRQAWRWAVAEGNVAVLQRTLAGYARLYTLIGLYEEASATLEWSVSELRQREADLSHSREAYELFCQLVCGLLSHAAAFFSRQALFDRAMILAQAAQQSVQELDLPISQAHALLRWGEAFWYQGRMAEAKPLLAQVMELTSHASPIDEEPQELRADALCLQGSTAVRMGKYKEAIHCYESSLHISRALQDAYREGRALHSLGTTFRNQGHFGEARSFLEQGLQLSRHIGDLHSESRSLNSLGDIAYYLGDYMDAQRNFSQVREIAVGMGDRRSESIALTNLGIIARDLGIYPQARELLTQGLHVAREIGFRRGEAWALVCLSLLHHQHRQEQAALDVGQQGLRIFEELSDDVGQAYAWTEIGHALAALQEFDGATDAYQKALALRRALAQPHLEMEVLAGLLRVDLARQALDEANRKAQSLLAYLQMNRLLGVEEPVLVYWSCARALPEAADAERLLTDARRMLEERAAAIDDDAMRASFLQIAAHRAIMQAWVAEGNRHAY